MTGLRQRSSAAKMSAAGLAVAATGMLLQIAAGSTLYPSLAGPLVLFATAAFVLFGPARWASYAGLGVAVVLGIGAIIGSAMSGGGLIGQLVEVGHVGIFVGSLAHVIGLVAAVTGGLGTLRPRPMRAA